MPDEREAKQRGQTMPAPDTLIVFDLDGTLVDTAPDLIGALNVVLADEGLAPRPLDAARSLVGRGARFLIRHGFEEAGAQLDGAKLDSLAPRFLEIYGQRLARESRPFPHALETLEALAASGVLCAVCTNKPGGLARRLLEELGLAAQFRCVIGADDAGYAKPDGRHLQHVLSRVAPGGMLACVMVGDSAADVQAARAFGAPVIVTSFGYTSTPASDLGADAVVDDLSSVPDVAKALLLGLPRRPCAGIAAPPLGADA